MNAMGGRSLSLRVAIIIPLFNLAEMISETIGSVLRQNYENKIIIVVDDGSTDGSLARVKAFGDAVLSVSGPNRGACHARNLGFSIAREQGCDLVHFLDADDYIEGDFLAGSVNEVASHGADLVISNMHIKHGEGQIEYRPRYSGTVSPLSFFEGWLGGDYVNPSGIVWRTELVERAGGWDESLTRAQDFDITLRTMLLNPVIRKNESGAAIYTRLNPNSVSRNESLIALESRYKATRKLCAMVPQTPFASAIPTLHQDLYLIARAAFYRSYFDLGREIMTYLRDAGFRGHPGTKMHRLVASTIGLEQKIRFTKAVRRGAATAVAPPSV